MLKKLLVLVFALAFSASLVGSAAMMKGGLMVDEVGTIESNACAEMMIACPSKAELTMEIPVFVPEKNGKLDYSQFHYLAVLPLSIQDSLWNKKIKIEGVFFKNTNTLVVRQASIFENGRWKTTWSMPKDMMKMMKM
jgi:hypothetical protein